MLGLNRNADYALRLMLDIGANSGAVSTADIARRQEIPYQFLRKVARTLVRTGLLTSERGARGGLRVARPAESITLLEIVSAFGPPALNRCTAAPSRCDRREICAVFPVWAEAQKEVERVLARNTLSGVVARQAVLSSRQERRGRGGKRELSPAGKRSR